MKEFTIEALDYRYILINNYKELEITEVELVILLLLDSLNAKKPTLVTGDQLKVKMNLSAKEIDECIVSLMNKGLLSYETVNGMLITSLDNLYKRIVDFIKNNIISNDSEELLKEQEDALTSTLRTLEEEMKRPLTPLEIDLVSTWFKEGISSNLIDNAINECLLKNKKVTIKAIDRIITKNLQHDDRVNEGFTTVDEKTKKDIKKAIEDVSYDWVNDNND